MDLLQSLLQPRRGADQAPPQAIPQPPHTINICSYPVDPTFPLDKNHQPLPPLPAPRSPMEVENQHSGLNTAAPPSTSGGAPDVLQNLLSIDDFEKQHIALIAARSQAKASTQSPAQAKKDVSQRGNAPAPEPIAISKNRSSANIQLFTQRCQTLAVTPLFDYTGDQSTAVWSATLTLTLPTGGEQRSLTTDGTYVSKKEAKEAVCALGLLLLSSLEASGSLSPPVKAKAPVSHSPAATKAKEEPQEPQENAIGILTEFAQAVKAPTPSFTEFRLGTHFSAELELPAHRPGEPFGGRTQLHPSKKAARMAAAQQALAWLREKGTLPPTHSPVRKRKTGSSLDDGAGAGCGLVKTSSGTSSVARVLDLANQLGLPQPVYIYAASASDVQGLHTVSSQFPGAGPRINREEGYVTTVRHVFGKKAAKEECARLTVVVLEDVKMERLAVVEKVLGKKAVDGGKENEKMNLDGDEEFLSATED